MSYSVIKEFEVEEGSTEDMWYEIVVKFRGEVVDRFLRKTMSDAHTDFINAGYQLKI